MNLSWFPKAGLGMVGGGALAITLARMTSCLANECGEQENKLAEQAFPRSSAEACEACSRHFRLQYGLVAGLWQGNAQPPTSSGSTDRDRTKMDGKWMQGMRE